jgi:hypothetical protein
MRRPGKHGDTQPFHPYVFTVQCFIKPNKFAQAEQVTVTFVCPAPIRKRLFWGFSLFSLVTPVNSKALANQLHGAEPFLRSRQSCSYTRTFQHFMELEGSAPCSQEPSTGPYRESDQSSSQHPHPIFLRSILILSRVWVTYKTGFGLDLLHHIHSQIGITGNTALSLFYTLSSSPLHTH